MLFHATSIDHQDANVCTILKLFSRSESKNTCIRFTLFKTSCMTDHFIISFIIIFEILPIPNLIVSALFNKRAREI